MSTQVKAQPPLLVASLSFALLGCSQTLESTTEEGMTTSQYEGETLVPQWVGSFPAYADLAILLDTQMAPVILAEERNFFGERFLSERWLDDVAAAFELTDVEDALTAENRGEGWRLVSARVTPCGPLGILPDKEVDAY